MVSSGRDTHKDREREDQRGPLEVGREWFTGDHPNPFDLMLSLFNSSWQGNINVRTLNSTILSCFFLCLSHFLTLKIHANTFIHSFLRIRFIMSLLTHYVFLSVTGFTMTLVTFGECWIDWCKWCPWPQPLTFMVHNSATDLCEAYVKWPTWFYSYTTDMLVVSGVSHWWVEFLLCVLQTIATGTERFMLKLLQLLLLKSLQLR